MRPTQTRINYRVAVTATALIVVGASVGAWRAQGPGGGGGGGRPMVPLSAGSLILAPDAHYGENVSMTAAVEQILTKTTFTVDQDKTKSTGKDILIIAPTLQSPVSANTYITIVGEVVKFDPADIARRARGYTLDLSSDLVERYRGKPAVLATSIVTADLTDIAKKPIVPMTPEEVTFSGYMKQISPASTALRQAADGSNAEQTKANTAILRKNFTDAQAYFKTKNITDAIGWAGDALKLMDSIDTAVAAGKWEDAKTGATNLTQLCTQCHTAHRERQDDGTYRIKG
jgi:hypothetical protein